jgi:hypothetical protein
MLGILIKELMPLKQLQDVSYISFGININKINKKLKIKEKQSRMVHCIHSFGS